MISADSALEFIIRIELPMKKIKVAAAVTETEEIVPVVIATDIIALTSSFNISSDATTKKCPDKHLNEPHSSSDVSLFSDYDGDNDSFNSKIIKKWDFRRIAHTTGSSNIIHNNENLPPINHTPPTRNGPMEVNKKIRLDDDTSCTDNILATVSQPSLHSKSINSVPKHILIVDDQRTTVKLIAHAFTAFGYKCDLAYDGGIELIYHKSHIVTSFNIHSYTL